MLWTRTDNFVLVLCILMGGASARLNSATKTLDRSDTSAHLHNEDGILDHSDDSRTLFSSSCIPGKLCYNNCENYLLSLSNEKLYELALSRDNKNLIGQYCYVQDNMDKHVGGRILRWQLENGHCTDDILRPHLCHFVSSKVLYLSQTNKNLYYLSHETSPPNHYKPHSTTNNMNMIGKYCYTYDNTGKRGACDYYTKGRPAYNPDGTPESDGVPAATLNGGRGTGCAKGGRNSHCYANSIPHLTTEEKTSMCTNSYEENSGAQIRWAIWNDYCMDEGVPLTRNYNH
mmetsp:Transcript_16961/g.23267  ORF Transcript_16961/g.23267 Transcript_16961/m.23267 type:complete len:287 (-) Transcript_16961:71-931(-)|eukprot:CAMPEP_0185726986 /NCGR_PEP_ID=MMETSP1171-20130828/2796_1 /TAXON_ID=374046 /ORGANISM="Helicotheca tamensis, Strain CCMP826" /LENGTH=286 /DNA_ID=CAMNT_0028395439 /DNA_START=60 /DNA_END=920 /DNA_ORIENTATION=-